jgi:hypothetical protein
MASGHNEDSWLQQCMSVFRDRHDRDFKFLSCHAFLKNQVRFVLGFDGAASKKEVNDAASTLEAIDEGYNQPVARPPLGVKATKKAKLQADVVTEVAARLGMSASGAMVQSNPQQPALAQISETLERMADATIGIYQMWTMQCMVGNDALGPSMRSIVEAALVQQQLAVISQTSPAISNALETHNNTHAVGRNESGISNNEGNSDKDGYMFLTQPGLTVLQSAVDVASELSGESYDIDTDSRNEV